MRRSRYAILNANFFLIFKFLHFLQIKLLQNYVFRPDYVNSHLTTSMIIIPRSQSELLIPIFELPLGTSSTPDHRERKSRLLACQLFEVLHHEHCNRKHISAYSLRIVLQTKYKTAYKIIKAINTSDNPHERIYMDSFALYIERLIAAHPETEHILANACMHAGF